MKAQILTRLQLTAMAFSHQPKHLSNKQKKGLFFCFMKLEYYFCQQFIGLSRLINGVTAFAAM